jgi:Helix-turn-helix domain
MGDILHTTLSAGRYLGGVRPIPTRTLERWRQTGEGPRFIRLGRQVRYRQSDLDAWLESRVRSSTSDLGAAC